MSARKPANLRANAVARLTPSEVVDSAGRRRLSEMLATVMYTCIPFSEVVDEVVAEVVDDTVLCVARLAALELLDARSAPVLLTVVVVVVLFSRLVEVGFGLKFAALLVKIGLIGGTIGGGTGAGIFLVNKTSMNGLKCARVFTSKSRSKLAKLTTISVARSRYKGDRLLEIEA
jgi:hypothetical protein